MKDFAKVTIYNKHLYVTRIEEVEAYTLDQLFSDMGEFLHFFNIIQSECRSRSPDIVYGPIFTRFGE